MKHHHPTLALFPLLILNRTVHQCCPMWLAIMSDVRHSITISSWESFWCDWSVLLPRVFLFEKETFLIFSFFVASQVSPDEYHTRTSVPSSHPSYLNFHSEPNQRIFMKSRHHKLHFSWWCWEKLNGISCLLMMVLMFCWLTQEWCLFSFFKLVLTSILSSSLFWSIWLFIVLQKIIITTTIILLIMISTLPTCLNNKKRDQHQHHSEIKWWSLLWGFHSSLSLSFNSSIVLLVSVFSSCW